MNYEVWRNIERIALVLERIADVLEDGAKIGGAHNVETLRQSLVARLTVER